MYDFELRNLRTVVATRRDQYRDEDLAGMSQIIDAIVLLNSAVNTLGMSKRARLDANGQLVDVWRIEGATVRGKQVYVDTRTLYLEAGEGGIQPVSPRNYLMINPSADGLSPEEMNAVVAHLT